MFLSSFPGDSRLISRVKNPTIKTGVKNRHLLDVDETPEDLSFKAAKVCINNSKNNTETENHEEVESNTKYSESLIMDNNDVYVTINDLELALEEILLGKEKKSRWSGA